MIVGTAGHIDHGKTTLVRALTGVDTDRLPEEKRRGISIELGYAYLDAPGAAGRIGFVDVPGHEKLVHTMVAGATGIDFALLLIAADDGVMPQTREHLAVLALLGIERGAVVITKADRASPERIADVQAKALALVEGTPLGESRTCIVSVYTGQGLDALKALLFDAAAHSPKRGADGRAFRLAVDRAFSLAGAGTVVTGTAHAGRVRVDDVLRLVPGTSEARVRSLHAQNTPVEAARAGERVALALAGFNKDDVERGQWLCDPAVALDTVRLDAELMLWPGAPAPLRSGMRVQLHVGAAAVPASVAVLAAETADVMKPGETACVQLVLQRPIAAWHGDRLLLRDAAARSTLAGGRVLDPFAPTRHRRTPQRLDALDAWRQDDPALRLKALLAASPHGLDLDAWRRAEGCPADADLPVPPDAVRMREPQIDLALDGCHAVDLRRAALDALGRFHAQQPEELGPDRARLRRLAAPRVAEPLWRALVAAWVSDGGLVRRGSRLQLPGHALALSATDERISRKVMPLLEAGGFDPPWVRDLAAATRESEPLLRTVLARLAQAGALHAVVKDLYYPASTLARAAAIVRRLAARDGELKAADFRDASGLGRKRAIQIIEFFDRAGLLRRIGDMHRLRADCALFGGEDA